MNCCCLKLNATNSKKSPEKNCNRSYANNKISALKQNIEEPKIPTDFKENEFNINECKRGSYTVKFKKSNNDIFGLTIAGGTDKSCSPQIFNFRPESQLSKCDEMMIGDCITSINGIKTAHLRHKDVVNLLKYSNEDLILELEYDVPFFPFQANDVYKIGLMVLFLKKEDGNFGFVLRGGKLRTWGQNYPLTIVSIRLESSADRYTFISNFKCLYSHREGVLQTGDRLVAINGHMITNYTLDEIFTHLRSITEATFTIEYDIVANNKRRNCKPFVVELMNHHNINLGLALKQYHNESSAIFISSIQPGSLADRNGSFRVGDQLIAINEQRLENLMLIDAKQLLQNLENDKIILEILPKLCSIRSSHMTAHDETRPCAYFQASLYSDSVTYFNSNLISRSTELSKESICRQTEFRKNNVMSSESEIAMNRYETTNDSIMLEGLKTIKHDNKVEEIEINISNQRNSDQSDQNDQIYECGRLNRIGCLCQSNSSIKLYVSLFKDKIYEDFGFSVSDAVVERGVYINRMRPRGPAEQTGLLRCHDRIIEINGINTETLECCMIVPLIASAGDEINLCIERNSHLYSGLCSCKIHSKLVWEDDDELDLTLNRTFLKTNL